MVSWYRHGQAGAGQEIILKQRMSSMSKPHISRNIALIQGVEEYSLKKVNIFIFYKYLDILMKNSNTLLIASIGLLFGLFIYFCYFYGIPSIRLETH